MRIILGALILLALVAGPVLAEGVPARSITVSGQAERKLVPDEAHLQVQVSALDAKLPAAKAEHDKKLRKVMDIAKEAGVAEAQIAAQSSNVQPQYSYENNSRNFKGYLVATHLDITLKKTENVGALLEKLMAAGLENKANTEWMGLLNVSYRVAEPNKIRDEMAADAIKNARAKAERMAAAAGASIGAVLQMSEGAAPNFNYPQPMPMMAMARGAVADAAPMAPPPGEQEVNTTVSITYELK